MQPGSQTTLRSTDRAPFLLGGVGCGCGMLLAALAFIVLVVMTASASDALPAARPDSSRPDIIVTVRAAFIQQAIVRALPSDALKDIVVNLQPGGVIALRGRLEVALLGQKLSAPFSLTTRLSVRDGRLSVQVTDVQVAGNATASAAQTMLGGLGERADGIINDQIVSGLGRDAYIMDVTTDEDRVVIRARWTAR